MTAVDVDALEAARAAATTGPWDVRWQCPEEAHHHDWDEGWIANPDGATVAVLAERYTNAPDDAALIVAAVNALEPLLAEVRRGRALRERLEGLASDFDANGNGCPLGDSSGNAWHKAARQLRALLAAVDSGEQP